MYGRKNPSYFLFIFHFKATEKEAENYFTIDTAPISSFNFIFHNVLDAYASQCKMTIFFLCVLSMAFIIILPSDCCKAAGSVFLLYALMSLVFSNLWDLSCQCTPAIYIKMGFSWTSQAGNISFHAAMTQCNLWFMYGELQKRVLTLCTYKTQNRTLFYLVFPLGWNTLSLSYLLRLGCP